MEPAQTVARRQMITESQRLKFGLIRLVINCCPFAVSGHQGNVEFYNDLTLVSQPGHITESHRCIPHSQVLYAGRVLTTFHTQTRIAFRTRARSLHLVYWLIRGTLSNASMRSLVHIRCKVPNFTKTRRQPHITVCRYHIFERVALAVHWVSLLHVPDTYWD